MTSKYIPYNIDIPIIPYVAKSSSRPRSIGPLFVVDIVPYFAAFKRKGIPQGVIIIPEIMTLVNEQLSAGSYTMQFNAQALPSGLYLYRLSASEQQVVKRMVLMK